MSDEIDEWVQAMRHELDRAMAEGRKTVTLTAPVSGLNAVIDIAHTYFRDASRTCMLCGAIRRSGELAQQLRNWSADRARQDWRRDAHPKRPR